MKTIMSDNTLLELRTAWIKSVAKIWTSQENGDAKTNPFCKELIKHKYNDYDNQDYGAMAVLEKYGLCSDPWGIQLQITESDEAPYWNPGTGKYDVENSEKIEQVLIYIPKKPKINATEAAAAFYEKAPSIFGGLDDRKMMHSNLDNKTSSYSKQNANSIDIESNMSTNTGSIPSANRFDIGNNMGTLYEFGTVLMDALSLTWMDEKFKDRLITKNPINKETGNIQVEEVGKAATVLKESFGFEFPWAFDLIIAEDNEAEFLDSRWVTPNKSRLVLVVPKRPLSLDNYGPIALASYNAGGSKYPFSCG